MQHFVRMDVRLRGRRGTLTLRGSPVRAWAPVGPGCSYVAGAAPYAHGRTFAWQARHFDSPGIAGARLGAGGARLQSRGRRNTFCILSNFCVAEAAVRAHVPNNQYYIYI